MHRTATAVSLSAEWVCLRHQAAKRWKISSACCYNSLYSYSSLVWWCRPTPLSNTPAQPSLGCLHRLRRIAPSAHECPIHSSRNGVLVHGVNQSLPAHSQPFLRSVRCLGMTAGGLGMGPLLGHHDKTGTAARRRARRFSSNEPSAVSSSNAQLLHGPGVARSTTFCNPSTPGYIACSRFWNCFIYFQLFRSSLCTGRLSPSQARSSNLVILPCTPLPASRSLSACTPGPGRGPSLPADTSSTTPLTAPSHGRAGCHGTGH